MRKEKLVVIGSGVVGQATGKGFAENHDIVFCDINPETLIKLGGLGYGVCSPELLVEERGVKAYFLSISTPTVDGKIQLDFLKSAVVNLGAGALKKNDEYCIIVVRSTVPPCTIEEMLIPLLEKYSGKKAGKDFGVCMNPEYLREDRNEEDFKHPWIVVIGEIDAKSGEILEDIYGPHDCPIVHISIKEAEIQKYVHNLYNACKISFFNEMRMVCGTISVDANRVFELVSKSAEASWNREYGIKDLGPYGGSCLPKDTTAFLEWANSKLGKALPLLDSIIRRNEITKDKHKK